MRNTRKRLGFGLCLLLFLGLQVSAQQPEGIHQGMVRVQGTVAMGIDVNKDTPAQRYYVYGEGEYLISGHVGVNGSIWGNIGTTENDVSTIGANDGRKKVFVHSILAGPVFHAFENQPLDLFFGVQPGFSLTTVDIATPAFSISEFQVSPTTSVHGGVAYYGSFFNLFAQARYVRTQHFSPSYQHRFNDLRLCIGLGFNFN